MFFFVAPFIRLSSFDVWLASFRLSFEWLNDSEQWINRVTVSLALCFTVGRLFRIEYRVEYVIVRICASGVVPWERKSMTQCPPPPRKELNHVRRRETRKRFNMGVNRVFRKSAATLFRSLVWIDWPVTIYHCAATQLLHLLHSG